MFSAMASRAILAFTLALIIYIYLGNKKLITCYMHMRHTK